MEQEQTGFTACGLKVRLQQDAEEDPPPMLWGCLLYWPVDEPQTGNSNAQK